MFLSRLSGFIIPLLLSTSAFAENIQLNPEHPNQYTVVRGDTLWDISGRFLANPWEWTKLWQNNPQIKNPDLIYPGDTLHFSIVDGQPRITLSRNVKLSPQIREYPIEQAIKLIPTDAISQFLTSPKVVSAGELENSPYVVDFAGEHILAGTGDRIYVRSIKQPQSINFVIYRAGHVYANPLTQEVLGYEAQYIAETTLEKSGDPATLYVHKADQEIRKGDRLMPNTESELALNFFPRPPEMAIEGSIISVLNGVSEIGQHNIVVIDKGQRDGLKIGHTLDIYQRGPVIADTIISDSKEAIKLPDELAGVLMVFRTFDKVSYALVLEATQSIHILDIIRSH